MNSFKSPRNRPFIFLSAAISLDGYISTMNGDSLLSNKKDWNRVHHLRAESDAIMVGSGAIRTDDSKLTVNEEIIGKKIKNHPIRVVVSSKGKIPLKARVITYRPDIPTIIATTSQCPRKQQLKLESSGCQIIKCGSGPLTDLCQLSLILKEEFHVKRLMVEGGSKLNGEMLNHQIIDEVHLAIAPVICGVGVPFFTLPKSFQSFANSPFFKIIEYNAIDDMIYLKMSVHYQSRKIP